MAASNNITIHVAGPILVQANIGPGPSFVTVGECRDGFDINFIPFTHDVKYDGAGGPDGDAGEIIFLNCSVIGRCQLTPYAGNYVNSLRAYAQATAVNGVMAAPGILYGASGALLTIKFTASTVYEPDGGWQFTSCQIRRMGDFKTGVKENVLDFEFRAINYRLVTSSPTIEGATLYSRV